MAEDLFTGCAEELAGSPELVRRLLAEHTPTTGGWCRCHDTRPVRHPCSIRQLAELASKCAAGRRAG